MPTTVPTGGDPARVDHAASGDARPPGSAAAVPVALELDGPHRDAVRGWVEGVLGWQAVDEATADLVPPAVLLVDRPVPRSTAGGTPTVLVIDDDAPAAAVADLVQRVAADLVVAWPSCRDVLADRVHDLLQRPQRRASGPRQVTVGGSAGGVGTTTLVLALTGLAAWAGRATMGIVRAPAPVPQLRVVPPDAIGAADLWARADLLPGVAGARVLGTVGGSPPALADAHVEVAVVDAGVDDDVDVLVCRPDGVAVQRVATTTAAVVVVNGEGPAPRRALAEAAGGRRLLALPWSARVGRAGLHGRVPASLPGSWLRRVAPLAEAIADP